VTRPGFALRDAAVGYASRGIPVLPLHYPITRRHGARPVPAGQPLERPSWSMTRCSCGDPGCGQVGKHPLGQLVPHGLHEATTNRARVMAWWTRYPRANIGLATGQLFDVLDLDGPEGVAALQAFAHQHDLELPARGPVARSGRPEAGWHYYLAPTRLGRRHGLLNHVDYQGPGGYVVAPPSRHASGHTYRWVRGLDHPLPRLPGPLQAELAQPTRRPAERLAAPVVPLPVPDGPGHPYARAALADELDRVAAAGRGRRNEQLWTSGRNLFNFVASGALDEHQVRQGLLWAAERNGLLGEEPRQTHRTIASARAAGLAHPRRPPDRLVPDRTPPNASPRPLPSRDRGERTRSRERR
jgi:Bifunctional DNA primase/polymerase, N-terminal